MTGNLDQVDQASHVKGEKHMAKTICTILGVVFILVGLAGFAKHDLLGAHLSAAHNVIHLVSGALALFFGLKGSLSGARMFCIIFGAVYLLLGIAGFALGSGEHRIFAVIPGTLELGTMDHVIHVALGVIFLIGGFITKPR